MYEVKDTNQAERAATVRCAIAFLQSATGQHPRVSGDTQHSDRNCVKQVTAL